MVREVRDSLTYMHLPLGVVNASDPPTVKMEMLIDVQTSSLPFNSFTTIDEWPKCFCTLMIWQ